MFLKKKKKRQSGVKPKQKHKIKNFFNLPILLLTLITCLFVGSFIFQMKSGNDSKSSIVDLKKIVNKTKNSYEKETGHRIQIEILNGCGQRHIARMYEGFLRDEGYDVMTTKNAAEHEYSIIQLHRGDPKMATHLSNLVGLNDSLVVERLDESLMFDLTLIIGNDFKELNSHESAILYHPIKRLILD